MNIDLVMFFILFVYQTNFFQCYLELPVYPVRFCKCFYDHSYTSVNLLTFIIRINHIWKCFCVNLCSFHLSLKFLRNKSNSESSTFSRENESTWLLHDCPPSSHGRFHFLSNNLLKIQINQITTFLAHLSWKEIILTLIQRLDSVEIQRLTWQRCIDVANRLFKSQPNINVDTTLNQRLGPVGL